jgi:Family of unknown function (DUF5681)
MNKNPSTEHLKVTMWEPGQSGNPAGRPKNLTTVLYENGHTKAELINMFAEIAFKTEDEIKEILDDDRQPMINKVVARTFYMARHSSNCDYKTIAEIMSYLIGKPPSNTIMQPNIIYLPINAKE